jgi:hypothetical protein
MDGTYTVAQKLAFLLILAGCVLVTFTALDPQLTGAWHLSGMWLLCGLIPYVTYGSLVTLVNSHSLLAGGVVLFGVDLAMRTALGFTAAASTDPLAPVWLATVLVLAILPAGLMAGSLYGRLAGHRAQETPPAVPG